RRSVTFASRSRQPRFESWSRNSTVPESAVRRTLSNLERSSLWTNSKIPSPKTAASVQPIICSTELLAYLHCASEKASTRSVVEATRLRKCALRRRVLATSAQPRIPKTTSPRHASRRCNEIRFETFRSLVLAIERATFNDTFDVSAVSVDKRRSGAIVLDKCS